MTTGTTTDTAATTQATSWWSRLWNSTATAAPSGGGDGASDVPTWTATLDVSTQEAVNGLNPLHYVPVVGMFYRAVTGEQIPTTMRVLGGGIFGGPAGIMGSAMMSLAETLLTLKPDQSRPATPVGMAQTGSEAGMQPVTPGTLTGTEYTSLASVTPAFLQPNGNSAVAQAGVAAYQNAALLYRRSEAVEKGAT